MKTNILLALLITLGAVSSCTNPTPSYTVTGSIPDTTFNGTTIYIHNRDNNRVIDSTIIENSSALVDIVREYAMKRTAQEILDDLVAGDVPSCILNQYKDRFSGEWLEQSLSNGYLVEHTYNSGNKVYLAQMPIYFESQGVEDHYARHRALGEDTEAIRKEFGE